MTLKETLKELKIPRSIRDVITAKEEGEKTLLEGLARLRKTAEVLLLKWGREIPQPHMVEGKPVGPYPHYSLVVAVGRKSEKVIEVEVATTGFHKFDTDLIKAPIVVKIGGFEGNLQLNPDPRRSISFGGDSRDRPVTSKQIKAYEKLFQEIETALGENKTDLVRRSNSTSVGIIFVAPLYKG